jgi:hypothetical protein
MPADNDFRFCYESPEVYKPEKREDCARDSQCCDLGIHISLVPNENKILERSLFCNGGVDQDQRRAQRGFDR